MAFRIPEDQQRESRDLGRLLERSGLTNDDATEAVPEIPEGQQGGPRPAALAFRGSLSSFLAY